jgi:NAD(P)H-dependent FMN reductase
MPLPLLQVVVASTRPGRVGRPVADWYADRARDHGAFDVEVLDLAEVALPFLDEPKHPRFREYTQDHTRAWSATVDRGDAFAFVMPEYNYGYSAPLKNALDFLWHEWNDKPAVLVGYGGVSGGTRAMQAIKPVLTSLHIAFAAEVPIPFVQKRIAGGRLEPNDEMQKGASDSLDALARLPGALAPLR